MTKTGKAAWRKVAMIAALTATLTTGMATQTQAAENAKEVDIMFTSDLHSHIKSFNTSFEGEDTNIGGFARIKTIINEQKDKNPDTLLVDGGDFAMGTLFQTIYENEAVELRLLGALGYDATTLGNHEFDYRSQGLANMLDTAADSGDELPSLLLCNIDWTTMDDEKTLLKNAFDNYGMKDYEIVEKNGVRIAMLGVFGKDALACAPTCALTFTDPIEAVKKTVATIKETEEVDMIVCLSHCGTSEIESKSEDEALAQAVPELDVIVSGHSHTFLDAPIVYGDTAIVSCGEYGECVGSFSMKQKEDGRWSIESYELIPTTEDVADDEDIAGMIRGFEQSIDDQYLSMYGYSSSQVIAHNEIAFSTLDDLYEVHTEHNLGDIMSDAYVYAVENAKGYDGVPVDVTVIPSGTVRDTYVEGDLTVSDIFNSYSLGIGEDGIPGYPVVSVYLTGEELKTACEIDASVSDYMPSARLYFSGLNFTYNPNRMILNRVTDAYLTGADGSRVEIENEKLYRVVADLYSAQMLGAVTDMSYGLLSLVPKDADGNEITDFADTIVYDGDQELKAWIAMTEYLGSFEKNEDGISEIPEYYSELHDRKVVDDTKKVTKLVEKPNKYAAMIVGVCVAAFAMVMLILVLLVKIVRRIRRKRAAK